MLTHSPKYPCRIHKGCEQTARLLLNLRQLFRVPLYAEKKRFAIAFHCFDQLIRRPGRRHQPWCQILDGLMVQAIDW